MYKHKHDLILYNLKLFVHF